MSTKLSAKKAELAAAASSYDPVEDSNAVPALEQTIAGREEKVCC